MQVEKEYLEKKEKILEKLKSKELVMISQNQLKELVKSKLEAYNLFKYGLKCYLPGYRYCSMEFLKQLLHGTKRILYKSEAHLVDVPRWHEFTINTVYPIVCNEVLFKDYLPDYKKYYYEY